MRLATTVSSEIVYSLQHNQTSSRQCDHALARVVQLPSRIAEKLPTNMDDIDLRPSHTGSDDGPLALSGGRSPGGGGDAGGGFMGNRHGVTHHQSMCIDPVTVSASMKKVRAAQKIQLVYAMLDSTLDLALLTDALRSVLKSNGARAPAQHTLYSLMIITVDAGTCNALLMCLMWLLCASGRTPAFATCNVSPSHTCAKIVLCDALRLAM